MRMVHEHLGEIIIALVIFALLCTAVWAIKGPMDGFFDNVADHLTQPTEPDIGDSGGGEVTEPETVPPYTYEVTYHGNGGAGTMEPSSFTSGTVVNLPANKFTKTGYSFSGWATTDTGEVVWADEAAVKNLGGSAGDVVELYAVWRPNSYTVELHANGGAYTANGISGTLLKLLMTYDVEQAFPENRFTRDGYAFKGWNTKEDGSGTAYADKASVKNLATIGTVVLYAQWEQGAYNLTYTLNGGTLPSGSKTTYSTDEEFVLPVPVKDGYTFLGWTGSNGGVPQPNVTIPKGSTGDKAYTANWVISVYDITYEVNGGEMPSNAPRSYTIDDAVTLPKPTMDGYTFGGWYTNEQLSGTAVTQIARGSTGDKVFYAKWTSNSAPYEVNHWLQRLNAGTEKNEDNYFVHSSERSNATADESITPAVKNITGFKSPATQTVTIAANGSTVVNYYYTRNSYMFTLGSADGVTTTGSSITGMYQYGATITLKGTANAGYTWSKWDASGPAVVSDKTECETTFVMPAGAVMMTPVATLDSYTITYHLNGGTQGSNAATKYDVTTGVTLPTPAKDGYTFGGWYVNEDLTGTAVTEIAKGSTGNKEFWAKWIVNKLDVTASGYAGTYDGKAHGISVSCEGATITYATSENGTYSAANPTFTDAGTYTVYYKVEKAGYQTVTGSEKVIINKASIDVSALPSQDGTLTYNGEEQAPEWKNYDSSKLTIGGTVKGTNANTYSATFTPKANYQWSDGTTGPKPVTWKIGKAEGKVELSATEGTLTYPATGTFEVTENASGGELSVKSSDEDVATVTIKDGVVTVKSGTKAGEATITVTAAATDNYKAASATYTVTVKNGTLSVEAEGWSGEYDGEAHSISVKCDGATITYATSANGTYGATNPTFKDAGTYTVYYKVEKAGYTTVTGSKTVVIDKANGSVVLSDESGTLTYPATGTFEVTKNASGGELSVKSSDEDVATATIKDGVVTVKSGTKAGEAIITVTSAATDNYKAASATYTVTVKNGTLDVEAKGWTGEYDGEAHGISVKCDGATITYATSANGTYGATNPTYTALGTYTVYYKVEKTGYTTVTGSAKVVIQDTTAPELTVEYKLPDGSSATLIGNITDSDKLTVYGTISDSGSGVDTVVVTVGGKDYVAEIDVDGNWSVDVDLAMGENDIAVVAKDMAGNSTAKDVSVTRCELEVDDDGGVSGVVPPAEEPEEVPEIPAEKLPELIEFTGGKFEKNTSYTPGTYMDVPYETTYTVTKYPVYYQNIIWSKWLITEDADGNVIETKAENITLADIDEKYSTWIVYDFETDRALDMDGVKGDSVELWTIYGSDDDSLEHAVYLAAYLNNLDGKTSRHIAKWNGSAYETYDADGAIGAVTVFTETYTVTGTNRVQITAPSTTTDYVYIPGSTMKAEKGMTWAEWLVSAYNTTGLTEPVIRDVDYNVVSLDANIVAGESYSIMEEVVELEPGLYDADDKMLASWDELVNDYGMDVSLDYTGSTYKTATTSPYYILNNYSELSTGVKLVMGDGVTSIGNCAFYNCKGLTSVVIPDSVTSIGNHAFSSCSGLTSVVIGDGVTSIGDKAFSYCTGLTSVVIGNGVTSIGSYAFSSCEGLTSVEIPDSVTSIGDNAFSYCEGLTSVEIPDSVTSIGAYAFYYCKGLTSVDIPDSVTSIGDHAFTSCPGLTSISVDSGNTSYHSDGNCLIETGSKTLIAGCKASIIPADGTVTSIGAHAFSGCKSLTSVDIPDSVTSIGDNAFYGCTGLTSVVIPDSVTSISSNVFAQCSGLTSVDIPDSVTSIGAYAFYYCKGLTSVDIPDSVTSIGDYAFYGCTGLTSVVIPDSVTSISSNVFGLCTGLTSVDIPDSVTSIGDYSFRSCTGLTSVVIPDSVTSIGDRAFNSCSGLTSVTIGSGVTKIGQSAFYACPKLTKATFKDTSTWYYTSSSTATSGGTMVTVTNASTAATYLRDTYDDYYWYKK